MDFAKNASFKTYGVICLPPLPSTLSEELSMDRRKSSEFFLRRRVCMLSDSLCRTTDSSLFSVNDLLSFLAWPVHISCASGPGTRGNAAYCTIAYSVHSCGYSSQSVHRTMHLSLSLIMVVIYSSGFTALAFKLRANKLSMLCTIVLH